MTNTDNKNGGDMPKVSDILGLLGRGARKAVKGGFTAYKKAKEFTETPEFQETLAVTKEKLGVAKDRVVEAVGNFQRAYNDSNVAYTPKEMIPASVDLAKIISDEYAEDSPSEYSRVLQDNTHIRVKKDKSVVPNATYNLEIIAFNTNAQDKVTTSLTIKHTYAKDEMINYANQLADLSVNTSKIVGLLGSQEQMPGSSMALSDIIIGDEKVVYTAQVKKTDNAVVIEYKPSNNNGLQFTISRTKNN